LKPANRSRRRKILLSILALLLVWLGSAIWPGGIRYSRFGLTVVGAVPIPLIDFTIGPGGVPGYRTKSHRITRAELETLVAPGLEHLIIADGWHRAARVDSDARSFPGVTVEILATPDAFARYNALRKQGKRVALLAHTTC
jgi:hypothetical protein